MVTHVLASEALILIRADYEKYHPDERCWTVPSVREIRTTGSMATGRLAQVGAKNTIDLLVRKAMINREEA